MTVEIADMPLENTRCGLPFFPQRQSIFENFPDSDC